MAQLELTTGKFIAGIIIAILASSAISVVVSTMLIAGPQGPQGEQGLQGEQGSQGIPGGFGAPDYDSGWIAVTTGPGTNVNHGLGTKELFVYMVGKNEFGQVNREYYGSEIFFDSVSYWLRGAYWRLLNDNEISLIRSEDDTSWLEIRVYIWVIS